MREPRLPIAPEGYKENSQGTLCEQVWEQLFGAGDRGRTDDNHVGNVALYQLSYTRIKILVERTESFGQRQLNLATRGLQSRSTCLANMEYHLLSEVAHAVSTDFQSS